MDLEVDQTTVLESMEVIDHRAERELDHKKGLAVVRATVVVVG